MAASEIRRAIVGNIPDVLRNCVNKEYFMRTPSSAAGYTEGKLKFLFCFSQFDFFRRWDAYFAFKVSIHGHFY